MPPLTDLFRKTQDDKFKILEKHYAELNILVGELYALFVEKSSSSIWGKADLVRKQQAILVSCERLCHLIDCGVEEHGHELLKREKKDSIQISGYVERLAQNINAQKENPADSKLFDQEKDLIMKVRELAKELIELIRRAIYESEYIFHHEYAGLFRSLLGKYSHVRDVVEKFSLVFQAEGVNPAVQKDFVRELIASISKIPSDTWSFAFSRSLQSGRLNCSGCASLLGLIIESTAEISKIPKVEFALPFGHAMVVVTFSDSSVFYCDPRNNKFEDITNSIERISEYGPWRVYRLKPLIFTTYRLLPTLSIKEGVLVCHAMNLDTLTARALGVIDEFLAKTSGDQRARADFVEAKQIVSERQYTKEDAQRALQSLQHLEKGFNEIHNSQEFLQEKQRFFEASDVNKAFRPIIDYVAAKPHVKAIVKAKLDSIKKFLFFELETLPNLGDDELEKMLKEFRQGKIGIKDANREGYMCQIEDICSGLS